MLRLRDYLADFHGFVGWAPDAATTPLRGSARGPSGTRIGVTKCPFLMVLIVQAAGAPGLWSGAARRQQIVDANVVVHPNLQ
jgi:hypothetical protein